MMFINLLKNNDYIFEDKITNIDDYNFTIKYI